MLNYCLTWQIRHLKAIGCQCSSWSLISVSRIYKTNSRNVGSFEFLWKTPRLNLKIRTNFCIWGIKMIRIKSIYTILRYDINLDIIWIYSQNQAKYYSIQILLKQGQIKTTSKSNSLFYCKVLSLYYEMSCFLKI